MYISKKIILIISIIIILIIAIASYFIFFQKGNIFMIDEKKQAEDMLKQQEKVGSDICLQKSGQLETRINKDHKQYMTCVFGTNRECPVIDLYNNQCPEGGKQVMFVGPRNFCISSGGEFIAPEIEEDLLSGKGECIIDGKKMDALEFYKTRLKNN